MIVDRRFAAITSNNIQKNDNVEMMTHLEGSIVDSLYDTALLSWHDSFHSVLPCIKDPLRPYSTFDEPGWSKLFDKSGKLTMARESQRLPPHLADSPHYDNDIAEEFRRMHSTFTPTADKTHLDLVADHLNASTGVKLRPSVPEPATPEEEFCPYVPLAAHAPVPMALVSRKPAGAPNNSSLHVPQNAAWISAFRNAKRKVFIQSPDLNAWPLFSEIVDAVRRGVEVEYRICLGYNDAAELLPFQGGINELFAVKLRKTLASEPEETKRRLTIGWYVAKDQNRPIHKKEQGRSCHVKLMIVDDQVGIQGSGNQDTQSYFHSQEVNVMIDSELICQSWMDAFRRNHNTLTYGMGSPEDGLWRDAQGNQAKESGKMGSGPIAWAQGAWEMYLRARGVKH